MLGVRQPGVSTRGPGGRAPVIDQTVVNGQMVAEWRGEFVPVVANRHAETEWPETGVVDSTEYQDSSMRTGEQRQLFAVPAVWGYPAATGRARTPSSRPTPAP